MSKLEIMSMNEESSCECCNRFVLTSLCTYGMDVHMDIKPTILRNSKRLSTSVLFVCWDSILTNPQDCTRVAHWYLIHCRKSLWNCARYWSLPLTCRLMSYICTSIRPSANIFQIKSKVRPSKTKIYSISRTLCSWPMLWSFL